MPELPEVEIVKQSLIKNIKSQKILKVIVRNRNLRFRIPKNFKSILQNKKIINIRRFSKYIIIELSNKSYCILHLGMSGTIHIIKKKRKNFVTNSSFYHSPFLPKKHNHVEFIFNKLRLIYNDPRRFGYFKILNDHLKLKNFIKKYGIEPFNKKFNYNYVKSRLQNKKKNIKDYLLDQKFVSGIGNIYASEILFESKINPKKKSCDLLENELKNMVKYSKIVLRNSIKRGGSSIRNFVNTSGDIGSFQKYFKVYEREGKNCPKINCDGKIVRTVISNRSTFYCNNCQKNKNKQLTVPI